MAIEFEVHDFIATVTLNRPDAMNAIDPETAGELREVWGQISTRDDIRVGILTGAGSKAFCAGVDLKKSRAPTGSFAHTLFGSEASLPPISTLQTVKPMIAAINGFALGGGLELAMLCDIRVAASSAVFGFPEVSIGSIAAGGGTQRLVRSVGPSDAMLMLLTGDRIDAPEALRIGLISRMVTQQQLLPLALAIARRIAGNAPLAVAATKRLVQAGGELPLTAALELERQVFGNIHGSEDRIEGRKAFAEKRKPVFRGR